MSEWYARCLDVDGNDDDSWVEIKPKWTGFGHLEAATARVEMIELDMGDDGRTFLVETFCGRLDDPEKDVIRWSVEKYLVWECRARVAR